MLDLLRSEDSFVVLLTIKLTILTAVYKHLDFI